MRNQKQNMLFSGLESGDMSGSISSSGIRLDQVEVYGVQAVFTGSPVGTLKLQESNDGTNWDDVTSSEKSVSAAGSESWENDSPGLELVRIVYTRTSGTGTLVVIFNGKGT